MWVKKPCSGGSRGGARGGPAHPLIFRPKWGPKGRKKFFSRRGPALISGLPWVNNLKKKWAVHTSFPTKYPFPPLLACKIFSRFLRSLGRAPWNSFSNFSWKKIPCTFYAPWCKKWCLISAFTTQTSGFTSLINYWNESASSVGVHEIGEWGESLLWPPAVLFFRIKCEIGSRAIMAFGTVKRATKSATCFATLL